MPTVHAFEALLLTHPLTPAGPVPTAQDPDGVYPYESYCETSRRPVLKTHRFIRLENAHVRADICPDLGGKVFSLMHMPSGRECLYAAPIVRPIRILPRQAYVGGGIEVSFPISHTPVQIEPVLAQTAVRGDRAYVWCGERELRFGMHWTVEFSLGAEDKCLAQRTCFHNPTGRRHPWMSWSNAGVPARPDTEFHFPGGPVLYHANEMRIIDWETEGPRTQSGINRMAGFFWREPDCPSFGVFTPSLGCGLYHTADPALTPGIKLWTDGVGPFEPWVTQWTLNREQCLEIQAGPIIDQSIKQELEPGQTHMHAEFWFPTDTPMDIHKIKLPRPDLPPVAELPRFGFARPESTEPWDAVMAAWQADRPSALPAPPGVTNNRWAPSGMEELGEALVWAMQNSPASSHGSWRLHLGAWLAGNDRCDEALGVLEESDDDRAHVLAGRLHRRVRQDFKTASEAFRRIQSPVFARHPQVVFERDLALAGLGPDGFDERRHWLTETAALDDEWLVERRAALLADEGRPMEARQLLESTPFQLIHQRYARTRLWKSIGVALGIQADDPPNWLGEDDLHEFGAYREYQED